MINKILYKNTTIIHKNIEIIGENAKSYFIKCNKCENDKILYNLPIEFPKGKRLKVECNCSKRFNEKQVTFKPLVNFCEPIPGKKDT